MDRDLSKTSSNGRKFKRFMATLLSVAMIVLELPAMAVPTMAATRVQAATNEAVVTEAETNAVDAEANVTEAESNETSSEEALASEDGIEEALEASNLETAQVVDGEEELESNKDVDIWLVQKSKAANGASTAASNVKLYPASISSAYSADDAINYPSVDKYNGGKVVGASDVTADGIVDTAALQYADSTRDYVFYVEPAEGYAWVAQSESSSDENEVVKDMLNIVYTDYRKINKTAYDNKTITYDKYETVEAKDSEYKVEDAGFGNDLKKVTISKSLLAKVITYSTLSDKDVDGNAQYAQAVLAIKLDDVDTPAWKALPAFTVDGKTASTPITEDRMFLWTESPASTKIGERGAYDYITIDAAAYVTGKTITKDMITLKYTPADGSDVIEYKVGTANTQMDAVPEHASVSSRGTIGGYYSDNGLHVSSMLTNAYIKGAGNLEVIIDTSSEANHVFNVTATASDFVKITKDADGTALASTIDTNTDYSFYVKAVPSTKGTRSISKILVKTKEEGKKIKEIKDGITSTGQLVTLGSDERAKIYEDIVITVTTTETVAVTVDGEEVEATSNYGVYNKSGKVISTSDVVSGSTLSFQVRAAAGKEVDTVSYYYGTKASSKTTVTPTKGIYTTKEAVKDAITIVVTTKDSEEKFDATLQPITLNGITSAISLATVYTGSITAEGQESGKSFTAGTAKDNVVSLDKSYYFTIKPASNYEVKSVKYRVGTSLANAGAELTAELVGNVDGYAVYKTDEAETVNNVYLIIDMCASSTIYAPSNEKVTVDFAKAGKSVTRPSSNEFSFTITPDDGVEVNEVNLGTQKQDTWTADTYDKDIAEDLEPTGGVYNISSTILSTNSTIYINVTTKETISKGYSVTWAVEGESSETEHPVLTGKVGSQQLTLGYSETTAANDVNGYLTATFKTTDKSTSEIGTVNAIAADNKSAGLYALSHDSKVTSTNDIITLAGSAGSVIATGSKIGTDTITANLEKGEAADLNHKYYTASLPATVKAKYENIKVVARESAADGTVDLDDSDLTAIPVIGNDTSLTAANRAAFVLKGTNTRTGDDEVLNGNTNGVTITSWKFVPDTSNDSVRTKKMSATYNATYSSTDQCVDALASTDGDLSGTIYVAGEKAESGVVVAATMRQGGDTKDKVVTSDGIDIVDPGYYGLYPELEITTGGEEAKGTQAVTAFGLEKNGSLNGANVKVTLYEKDSAFSSDANYELYNETNKLTAVNTKAISLSKKSAEYTAEFNDANTAADGSKYLTVSGTSGSYKVSVNKAPVNGSITITLTISAKIGRYVVDTQDINFAVVSSMPKNTVYLKLDDTETKDEDDKIIQQALTSSYYTAKNPSIVEENGNVTTIPGGDRGAKFENETTGSKFVLPKESDFDSSKLGKNRVLVAWLSNGNYYYPGESVIVNGTDSSNEYTPVWLDEYEWKDVITGSDRDSENGKGSTIYNGNTEDEDEEEGTISYTKFSAVKVDEGTVSNDTDVDHTMNVGGKLPVVLWLMQNNALTEDTKAEMTAQSEDALKTAEQTDKFVSGKDVTLTSTSVSWKDVASVSDGVITGKTATTTDQRVTAKCELNGATYETYPVYLTVGAAPEYTVSFANDTTKTFYVNQYGAELTPTFKNGSTTISANYDKYKWEWTSSDKSVAEVEASTESGSENKGLLTLKKAGKATISLSVTDAFGVKTEKAATLEITVKASDVTATILDPDGEATDRIYVEQKAEGNTDETDYSISFSKSTGISIDNDRKAVEVDGTYLDASESKIEDSKKITVKTNAQTTWKETGTDAGLASKRGLTDDAYVVFAYSYNDIPYSIKVPVSTYYKATLTEDNANAYITKDGKKIEESGNVSTATIKVTTANQERSGSGKTTDPYVLTYNNIDLSSYGAVYEDTDDPQEFIGWNYNGDADTEPLYTDSIASLDEASESTGALNAGGFVLKPVFVEETIKKATTSVKTITLSNEKAKGQEAIDSKTVTFNIDPYNSKAPLTLVPDTIKFYGMVNNTTASTTAFSGESLNLVYATPASNKQTRPVTFSATGSGAYNDGDAAIENRRAGSATIQVLCYNNDLGTLKLYVNGYDGYSKHYYENGEIVKNDSREVAGNTWYFDNDGLHVTGDAILTLADGTKILIIEGELATAGEYNYTGEDGVTRTYYVNSKGVILTGWITKAGEVTTDATKGVYYADPDNDGGLVYKDFATIEGKLYYFDSDNEKATQTTAKFTALDNGDNYEYYFGADGVITTSALVKVGDKQYLANEKGQKVTYAMTKAAGGTEGKYTVGGNVYIIAEEDDTAELEDRQYYVSNSIAWSEWPETFKVADGPNMTATATVYSEKQQKQLTGQEVVVTLSSNSTGLEENNVFYTATADLSKYYADSTYTEKAKNITIEETYIVKDGVATIADKQYFVSIDWSAWPETFKVADGPKMTATATVYSEKQKKQLTGQKVNVTLKSNSTGLEENHVFYEATADLSKYYADSTYTKKAENQVTSETYIEKDGTATKADKKIVTKVSSFSWTPSANKDYKKDTVVTATVTVSYKLEKAGTTGSEVINATVNKMTNSSTKKIEYLAYVNPTGYYKADGTAYDWSKVTATKTYIVNESGEGVSEGITVEGIEDEYYYTGVAIKPVVTVTDATADKVLVLGTDYTVKYQNNTKVGKATVIITGKGNYDKQTVTKDFKIVDPMEGETATDYYEVKSVKYDKEDLIYDGTAKAPSKLTIATKEGATVTATWNGSDYDIAVPDVDGAKTVRVVVANNVNKGSGTIAVYGSKTDRPVKKNFSIKAADMSTLGDKITVNAEAAPYSKKGAKAEVSVTYENGAGETVDLVEGRDYTVKYGYTKKKDAGEKAGNVTITGKNNFSKKATTVASFDIEKLEISESNIIVDAYEKVVPKSLKVKVFDEEGEEVNNKSYSIVKITKDDADITTSKDKLVAGDEIYVTVKGDGVNLAEDEVEIPVTIGTKLSSAKFNAKNLTKTYEGTDIKLDDSDLEKVTVTVKINKVETKLVAGEDYEIVGYKNNNKKGNMTVFVKGIGDKVSGFAKFTVKVNAKKLEEAK